MQSISAHPTIHWISPLPPAQTDIAHYTARILPSLSARAEVILWTDAPEWDLKLERYCTVKKLNPDIVLPRDFTAARRCTGPEILFVHIGNSWVYHAGLLRLVQRIPAIVVLHDLAIQELMVEAVEYGEWEAPAYLAGMKKWYGTEGLATGQACLNKDEKGSAISAQMPGFELVLDKARAVLTHTRFAHDAVTTRLPHLPCSLLPLPFEVGPMPTAEPSHKGPLRLLQFGWIGPNRRLEQVLKVLAEMPPDFDYRLDVMGKIWNQEIIHAKVAELNLGGRIRLHGFVPEAVLDDAIRQADLVLNLRHPSMGEASGSQLRIWNAGAASAVTREGWYADLPDDVAYGIDLKQEAEQLKALFLKLAADRSQTRDIRIKGRAFFEDHHAPGTYADAILALMHSTAQGANQTLTRASKQRLEAQRPLTVLAQARLEAL